jgi:hypothetical protein
VFQRDGNPRQLVDCEIFNVGGNELNMTILELGEKIARMIPGCKVERKQDIIDPHNYLVDFQKIRTALGSNLRFDIQDGVNEIIRSYEEGKIHEFDDAVFSNMKCLKRQRDREPALAMAEAAAAHTGPEIL